MATLSITKAWNETTEFMRREARLVLPIAFLLISLPGAMLQYVLPTPEPGVPFDLQAWMDNLPLFFLLALAAGLISLIGTIAINYLAIRAGATVGEALQVGLRRFIFLFLASLLLALAAVVACAPLFLLVIGNAPGEGPGGLFLLLLLIYMLLFIAAWIRLMMMSPVTAAENVGPIGIITRSWALTRGYFWKLLGFVILFAIAAIVAIVAISMVVGIIVALATGAPPTPGSTAAFVMLLVTAILQAIVTAFFATMAGRIYVQLSGTGQAEVFA